MIKLYHSSGKLLRLPITLLFIFCFDKITAQISITSPVNNQVFQRDQNGFAELPITAFSAFLYERIVVTLTPSEGNTHSASEYSFDYSQIREGFLTTGIRVETGWYELKIKGFGVNHTDSAVIKRVGVGEVFLVTGNSNAMGIPGLGSKDASEHVVSFNKVNKYLNTENITVAPDSPMQSPAFDILKNDHFIFPNGEASWYWGELGDLLHRRWNTPVLFFNAAWAAANAENYRDAATGKDAYNLYVGKFWPNRQPYSNIINTLRYQTSTTGLRAILFSHGENDAQLGFNENDYFNNIRTLIQNSRTDAGYNSAWFLARNSVSNQIPNPYLPVINAQNRLTEIPQFNAFKGPLLDTIQMPRPVSGHFENVAGGSQGLTMAAAAWNRSLSDEVMQSVTPFQPDRRIQAGVVPAAVSVGNSFLLPYRISGSQPAAGFHAELLSDSGSYVMTVGSGLASPLSITLPAELDAGYYRLRLLATGPVMPGSISERFYVSRTAHPTQLVRGMTARPQNGKIDISWVTAYDPALRQMVLQKTTDGIQYTDLLTLNEIPATSQVSGYSDDDRGEKVIFYRVRLEFSNGSVNYSPLATLFRDQAQSLGKAFPNPVSGLSFYFRKTAGIEMECRLFDAAGREHPILVSDRESPELLVIRPVHDLPRGTYILRTSSDAQSSSQLILVK